MELERERVASKHTESKIAELELKIKLKQLEIDSQVKIENISVVNNITNTLVQFVNFSQERLEGLTTGVMSAISKDSCNEIPYLAVQKF